MGGLRAAGFLWVAAGALVIPTLTCPDEGELSVASGLNFSLIAVGLLDAEAAAECGPGTVELQGTDCLLHPFESTELPGTEKEDSCTRSSFFMWRVWGGDAQGLACR
jgi:hypothetical protein